MLDSFRADAKQILMRLIFVLLISPIFLTACVTSPLGRRQLHLMPTQQMNSMGSTAFGQIKEKQKLSKNKKEKDYVHCIVDRLSAAMDREQTWDTAVFVSEEPNAFALPGGHVGVQTGMFKVAKTPDQLAAVIGHEMGHVLAEHGNERISQALAVQGALVVTDAALQLKGEKRGLLLAALGLGAQFGVLLPYSRIQESEADLIGQKLMANAGFDPRAAIELWRNMESLGGNQPPQILSTHPAHQTRMKALTANLTKVMPLYESAIQSHTVTECKLP